MTPLKPNQDVIRVESDPTRIDAKAWNALLATQSAPTPFMRQEYLAALHSSGSAVPATGWAPRFVTMHSGHRLVAAAPAYLKSHSYGEYVFDWAWADAYQRHGLHYYPKLLLAVPFTPVAGSRLMAIDDSARSRLLLCIARLARDSNASSAHVLFHDASDLQALKNEQWLHRRAVQFHWIRDAASPASNFLDYIARMQREKRKKVLQERRRVADAGIRFTVHEGDEIDAGLWDFFHRCYVATYAAHRSTPYLRREFFGALSVTMPEHWLMFVARRGESPVAASLLAIDRDRGAAWGRYWGATEFVPCLHFEACYYQPLQWCIEQGFERFEGGAQGEHKMARGLLPVGTSSAHWLSHPEFSRAIDEYLQHERAGIDDYIDELRERNPFRPAKPDE